MGVDLLIEPRHWSVIPGWVWFGFFFVLGSVVGSFLNVCIYRLPRGLSIVWPPSHCPACKKPIPWYLNIPLVSWWVLRGRCRWCNAPISPRYFVVELLTASIFSILWLCYGQAGLGPVLAYCVFVAGLIAASFIDAEHYIIPDELTIGGMVVGFLVSGAVPALHGVSGAVPGLTQSALGIAAGLCITYGIVLAGKLAFGRYFVQVAPGQKVVFGESTLVLPGRELPYEEVFHSVRDAVVFLARRLELIDRCYWDVKVRLTPIKLSIGKEVFDPEKIPYMEAETERLTFPRDAMGLGDVKFLGAIGAFTGWQGVVFSLMLGSMIGALVGMGLIVARRRAWGSHLPFGPYVAVGAVFWLFGGRHLLTKLFNW